MQRQTIGLIWIGGLVLAAALYAVGPDRFLAACLDLLENLEYGFHYLLFFLGTQAFNVVRALAIALFAVFLVLGFTAARRGLRAGWALVIVTVVFLVLVWRPEAGSPGSISRWFAALVLALSGAVVMTQRLMGPGRVNRPPPGSWPPQGGRPG